MNRSVCSRRSRAICATARCINCSIRLLPIYRWCTLQDATQRIINVLRSWISPTPVSLEHKLCWECHTLLQQVPDDESAHEPQYGHKNVCYVCGISTLRRARTHPVPPEGPERDVILALMFPHLAPLLTKVCYACWRVAKHNVQRQMQQDSTSPHIRFSKEEEIDVTESSILLPPPLLQNMIPQRRGPDVDHLQCNNTSQACRICQCNEPSKKICDLKSEESNETGAEIVLFCLSIQVDDSLTTCDELCSQCYEKIISFFNFKHFALKNNTLENDFKSHEVFLSYSNNHESPVWSETEIKSEPEIEVEAECSQSDDELLSDIKKIKYEFIPETSETKDNESQKVVHEPKDIRRFPCNLCNKTFTSYYSRTKHKRITHFGLKHSCPICKKKVKDLKIHQLTLHDCSNMPYECDQCGLHFMTPSARKDHMTVHKKGRLYACDQCDATLRSKSNLYEHKKDVHEAIESYLCHICSKRFVRKKSLVMHLQIHSNKKPYKCEQCAKAFTLQRNLKEHMTTHVELEEFHCTVCKRGFKSLRYLSRHMETHFGEKKYACGFCGRKFLRSDARKAHERTKHLRFSILSKDQKEGKE